MKLLVLDDPILCNSGVSIWFLKGGHLLLLAKISLGQVLILDLDDVLLVIVNNGKQFPFDLEEVLGGLVFGEVGKFFAEDEVCVGRGVPVSRSMSSAFFFFMVEFQWFLMELSVRPGSILVISAHLLPWAVCARNSTHSSWGIHSTFRMLGFRWLCHR